MGNTIPLPSEVERKFERDIETPLIMRLKKAEREKLNAERRVRRMAEQLHSAGTSNIDASKRAEMQVHLRTLIRTRHTVTRLHQMHSQFKQQLANDTEALTQYHQLQSMDKFNKLMKSTDRTFQKSMTIAHQSIVRAERQSVLTQELDSAMTNPEDELTVKQEIDQLIASLNLEQLMRMPDTPVVTIGVDNTIASQTTTTTTTDAVVGPPN